MDGFIENIYGYCYYEFKDDYVHIYNLFIKPSFRRQGKAKDLLKIVISKIRNTGWKDEILIVTDNKKLRSFYERLGLKTYSCYM